MTTASFTEPYQPRAIHHLENWELEGFRMKVYGIAYRGERPAQKLCNAARNVAAIRLAESALDTRHYGVGFVGIHEGKGANFVFIDWWADKNELHHHAYISADDDRTNLVYQTPSGLIACVWDLHVLAFEREAWVNNVMKQHRSPDIPGYLDTTLNCKI